MTEDVVAHRGIDTTKPNIARVYDYFIGGKDNFAVDRMAAEQALTIIPDAREAGRAWRSYDSIECLLSYLDGLDTAVTPRQVLVGDFEDPGRMIAVEAAWFVRAGAVGSPMGAGVAAFPITTDSAALSERFGSPAMRWETARTALAHAAHAGTEH